MLDLRVRDYLRSLPSSDLPMAISVGFVRVCARCRIP